VGKLAETIKIITQYIMKICTLPVFGSLFLGAIYNMVTALLLLRHVYSAISTA